MLKLHHAAALGLCVALLGACEHYGAEATHVEDGFELQRAQATTAPEGAFAQALHQGYVSLAQAEFSEGDYEDSDRFARRAQAVAAGQNVEPEHPITHRWIPLEHRADLFNGIWRLQRALRAGAREWAPEPAARAQVMYDCWVQEQEENFQPDDIAACRDAFLEAMDEVEALMPTPAEPAEMPLPGPYVVFFDFDSSALSQDAVATLDEVAEDYDAAKPTQVIVQGHTDRAGTDRYNMALSQRRADAVFDYLTRNGVPGGAIAVDYFGESRPQVPTADGVPEQANRRVEIEFEK
ncbi:MAG: OmpA family protein [Kiloniellales bacterium]|nr:OmpA family protein [Kiloniellales bacterium]